MRKSGRMTIVSALLSVLLSAMLCLTACSGIDINAPTPQQPQKETCTVVFFENGGSTVAPATVERGGKVARPDDPTRDGYTFGGWYQDIGFKLEWKFDTNTVTASTIVLYAKWDEVGIPIIPEVPDTCGVVFVVGNGGTIPPQMVEYGKKITKPTDPTRSGYTFGGWYTDSACTTEWNFDATVDAKSIILYAKWTPNQTVTYTCVVVFVAGNGGTIPSQTVDYGKTISQPTDPTRDGYSFGGWYTDSACTSAWNFRTAVNAPSIVLYAKWTPVQVTPDACAVVFVTNGGGTIPSQTVEYGKTVARPTDPTRSGYTFGGWYTDSGCTSAWNFGVAVSSPTLTLYAKWTPNQTEPVEPSDGDVCVTFNVGLDARKDGLSNPPAKTVKSGYKVAEPTVARAGYTLDGWYLEDGNVKWDFAHNTVSNNTTLFARWISGGGGGGTVIDYTPTMTNNNTLYIHYLRTDDAYDGWTAWVWTTGNGTRCTSMAVDKSGTVIAVDLTTWGNPSSLKFKIAVISESNQWGAEDGGDVTLNLSEAQKVGGSYHWYVTEGKTAHGSNKPTAAQTVGGTTEPKRESRSNVDRSYAQNLPVMNTVSGWDDMGVGYQIFVASFCDSDGDGCGDIQGIIKKLDYLESLNVDVLWLTPIQSSDSYHGYDCYDYYCIDSKFGTNADYRQLVYEVHRRGMKIIMDLVVNHTSPQNEWFIKSKAGVVEEVTYQDGTTATVNYRDFYRWKNSGGNRMESAGDGWYFYSSFGSNMPELNYDYQPVRDAMVDVGAYWMNYGLDGFRMDAIKHLFMWDESENEPGDVEGGSNDRPYNYNRNKDVEFFKEFNYKLKTKYPNCFLLGEQLSGDVDNVSPFYQGMDSLFDFNTYFDLPGRLDGGAQAQAAKFNENAGKYNSYRQNGRPINGMISSNHDEPRLSYKLNNNTDKMKLYMAVIMTMPGLSWIYYGDEIGLNSLGSNDNTYRQSMKWTDNWQYKCTKIQDFSLNDGTASVAAQESDSSSLLSYVKSLTKLRNDYPVLINGTATCSAENGMLKISVTNGSSSLTVYHNFGGSSKTVSGTPIFGSNTIPAYGTTVVR